MTQPTHTDAAPRAIGVLTSGGDSQGMNAAVRAVARVSLARGVPVFAIYEGYQGMVDGGDRIRPLNWNSMGGIMQRGGTVIGTARSAAFRTREGRLKAARNLVEREIDRLVVIGGDGSLTGANIFRQEWPGLLEELAGAGLITRAQAGRHAALSIAGLVGSIDNDMHGTDMTIGADSALRRIADAIDAISSTAASHQRSFVVEVMGRHCGYLALMSAIAGGCDYVLIPENPPEDGWEERMCGLVRAGRAAGRRASIVVIAEGARDRHGQPISSEHVRQTLADRLGEDVRVTILGHVQRGGAPSAFDRWMSTLVGYAAVEELLSCGPGDEPKLIGMRYNRLTRQPLMECVQKTQSVAAAIAGRDYAHAMTLRGGSFTEATRVFQAISEALPTVSDPPRRFSIAILNAGAPAPGMNTAVYAAVRLGLDQGLVPLVVRNGFEGLIQGRFEEFNWGSVDGWGSTGGAELGTSRKVPGNTDLAAVAQALSANAIDGLLVIGGWDGYQAAHKLLAARDYFAAFHIPIVCLPCSINNDLPGSELSIGADTALNTIVDAVDKIKTTAIATQRCYVVEVMGRECGYLALMSGLACGAERAYLPEEGVTLNDLLVDVKFLVEAFQKGKRVGVMIRNEHAHPVYTAAFMRDLFEVEGGDLFDVRQTILGHMQQGGSPSPFDRIQATRLASRCIAALIEQLAQERADALAIGIRGGRVEHFDLRRLPELADEAHHRPKEQWWLELRPIARVMAQPGPKENG